MSSLCNTFPALLWAGTTFDGRCYFYVGRDCPGWEPGSICARLQREIPMSEPVGVFGAETAPETPDPQGAVPAGVPGDAADPGGAPAAEAAGAPETVAPEPAEVRGQDYAPAEPAADPVAAAPETTPDPAWLIDLRQNAPGWLVAFAEDVHTRLQQLGG